MLIHSAPNSSCFLGSPMGWSQRTSAHHGSNLLSKINSWLKCGKDGPQGSSMAGTLLAKQSGRVAETRNLRMLLAWCDGLFLPLPHLLTPFLGTLTNSKCSSWHSPSLNLRSFKKTGVGLLWWYSGWKSAPSRVHTPITGLGGIPQAAERLNLSHNHSPCASRACGLQQGGATATRTPCATASEWAPARCN